MAKWSVKVGDADDFNFGDADSFNFGDADRNENCTRACDNNSHCRKNERLCYLNISVRVPNPKPVRVTNTHFVRVPFH